MIKMMLKTRPILIEMWFEVRPNVNRTLKLWRPIVLGCWCLEQQVSAVSPPSSASASPSSTSSLPARRKGGQRDSHDEFNAGLSQVRNCFMSSFKLPYSVSYWILRQDTGWEVPIYSLHMGVSHWEPAICKLQMGQQGHIWWSSQNSKYENRDLISGK